MRREAARANLPSNGKEREATETMREEADDGAPGCWQWKGGPTISGVMGGSRQDLFKN